MRKLKTTLMTSLSGFLLALAATDAAAQPSFKYPIGAWVGGDGFPTTKAGVRAPNFVPPIIATSNDSGSLLSENQIVASNQIFAGTQDSLNATAQRSGFCGPATMVEAQVLGDDDWSLTGDPATIRYVSAGQADHRITGWGNCVQLFDHGTNHQNTELVDAPFTVSAAGPNATLDIEMTLRAMQTPGPGLPVVPATGSKSGSVEIWRDANADGEIDPAVDERLLHRRMNTGIGDTIGPAVVSLAISTSDAFVARFHSSHSTSMAFRPVPNQIYNPSSLVDTSLSVGIRVR